MFTSGLERRLWLWALATVIAIYSTLGLARDLAGFLRDRDLLDTTFFVVFSVVGLAIAVQAFTRKASVLEIAVGVGVIAVFVAVALRMALPEERTHLFEYALVSAQIYHALIERRSNGRVVRSPGLLALVVTAVLGWVDEGIQWVLPDRVYDIRDVGFNALAALGGVLGTVALRWARRRALTTG